MCHRLSCNDTEFLSARCTEAVILNCCGKGIVTLFYGLIRRVRSQGLKICDGELGVYWVKVYIPKIYHIPNSFFSLRNWHAWLVCDMLYLMKAVLWKGTQNWPAQTTAWHLFAGDVSWFWPIHIHDFVLCGQTLLPLALSKVFCLPSSQLWCCAVSLFHAPSLAENGLSGLLKVLESLNDSEGF